MFLTITFFPYGLPQILLHILNEHDEYFQMIYSLLGNSMIRILHIRQLGYFFLRFGIKTEQCERGIKGKSIYECKGLIDVTTFPKTLDTGERLMPVILYSHSINAFSGGNISIL